MQRLPLEIQKEILFQLDPISILSACQLNRYFNKLISTEEQFQQISIVRLLSTYIVNGVTKELPHYEDGSIHNLEDWLNEFVIKSNPKFKNKSLPFVRVHILKFKQKFETTETSRRTLVKLPTIGDSGTGKTALMYRYVKDTFSLVYKATIGADFFTKEVTFGNARLTLQFWDTAGQERYQSLGVAFYRGADTFLVTHDTSNSKSFEALPFWLQEIRTNTPTHGDIPIILVGTKIDLESQRQTPFEQALSFAQKQHLVYIETSSKSDINVKLVFRLATFLAVLAKDIKECSEEWPETKPGEPVFDSFYSNVWGCSC